MKMDWGVGRRALVDGWGGGGFGGTVGQWDSGLDV